MNEMHMTSRSSSKMPQGEPESPSSAARAAAATAKRLCEPPRVLGPDSSGSRNGWSRTSGESAVEQQGTAEAYTRYDITRSGVGEQRYSRPHTRPPHVAYHDRTGGPPATRGDGNNWPFHKRHFGPPPASGEPHHEYSDRSVMRHKMTISSHPSSHHHQPSEEYLHEHHQNRHQQQSHHSRQRVGGSRYGKMRSYDQSSSAQQQSDIENVFQRQEASSTVQEPRRFDHGRAHSQYDQDEVDDRDIESSKFGNGAILRHKNGHSYGDDSDDDNGRKINTHRLHHRPRDDDNVNIHLSKPSNVIKKTKQAKRVGLSLRNKSTPTPINVPRSLTKDEDCRISVDSRRSPLSTERSSVFRSRPSPDAGNDIDDQNSPQRILLSLRTTTKSFDDKNKSTTGTENDNLCDTADGGTSDKQDQNNAQAPSQKSSDPLSPQAPPRIQHSHHQHFFEPQRTPRTPKNNSNGGSNGGRNSSINGGNLNSSIEATSSFNLFNQSFDSPFADADPYIQSSSNTPAGAGGGEEKFFKDSIFRSPVPCGDAASPSQKAQSSLLNIAPPRSSLSITASPYLTKSVFSFSPRPTNYKSNNHKGGQMSLTTTPRVETGFASPGGMSMLGSVGDICSNQSFGGDGSRAPPVMPSAKDIQKAGRNRDGVEGRTIVLGPSDRLRRVSQGKREGERGLAIRPTYSISPRSEYGITEEVGKDGRVGGAGHLRKPQEGDEMKPLLPRNSYDPSPSSSPAPLSSSHAQIGDVSMCQVPRVGAPTYAPQCEPSQNQPRGERHGVCNPTRDSKPKSLDVPKLSSAKRTSKRRKILPPPNGIHVPHFYHKLTTHKDAFNGYTFLLPALKAALSCKKDGGDLASQEDGCNDSESLSCVEQPGVDLLKTEENQSPPPGVACTVSYSPETQLSTSRKETKPSDLVIARRRLTSAIYAFGGNRVRKSNSKNSPTKTSCKSNIFRVKRELGADNSLETEKSVGDGKSITNKRTKYELALSNRYFENENRISWEVEEDPPIQISSTGLNIRKKIEPTTIDGKIPSTNTKRGVGGLTSSISANDNGSIPRKAEVKLFPSTPDDKSVSSEVSKQHSDSSTQPKMRYRCKLCGQPKQNHICPFQQSLQRSIGVTVYPAVNAFTAREPGSLAPALSEMNNFVHGQDGFAAESTPSRSDRMMSQHPTGLMVLHPGAARNVTPESLRNQTPHRTPFRAGSYRQYPPRTKMIMGQPTPGSLRKRSLSPGCGSNSINTAMDRLFVDSADLRQEQYRIVSSTISHDSFVYPLIQLPYKQRKSLSDNLFALSKGIPQLTDECAKVLRQARESEMWDVAVAELMTQVVVVVHCPENDLKMNGLSRYLLSLGFSC